MQQPVEDGWEKGTVRAEEEKDDDETNVTSVFVQKRENFSENF